MDPFNSRFILKEKRWLWIDYDKGISIILVGYGHCYGILQQHGLALDNYPFFNYIGVFLYGFRMPLFFIVSGLLIGKSLTKKGLSAYIGDRFNNILYPLCIWGFLQITLQLITNRFSHNDVQPISYLNLIINPRETGHFWYLNALFCIGVIYAFLKAKLQLKPLVQVILGLVLFAGASYIHIHNINAGFLTDVFEYYLFFALGDLMSNLMLAEKNVRRFSSWKIFFPLLALFLTIQYYFTQINIKPTTDGINYVQNKLPFFFLMEALVGCAISINFSFLLQKYRALTFLRVVGFHSLFIYCMQIITMTAARVVFVNVLKITYVPALILLVWSSGIMLPIFFYNFCLRYNLWWLYTFRKPAMQVEYLQTRNIFSSNNVEREEQPMLD